VIKRHPNIDLLKQLFPIPDFEETNMNHWEQLHQLSIQAIVNANGALPVVPPFEKHPYLETLDPQSTATGLMIGTFPPITYLCNLLNIDELNFNGISSRGLKRPILNYFHGNIGTFWDLSPFDFNAILTNNTEEESIRLLKLELSNRNVIYSDIIKYCQRTLGNTKKGKLKYTANDTDLQSLFLNESIVDFLFTSRNINRLYFTNSYLFGQGGNFFNKHGHYSLSKNDAFQLFLKAMQINNIKIEIFIPNSELDWFQINEDESMSKNNRIFLNQILKNKTFVKIRLTKGDSFRCFEVASSVSPVATGKNYTTSQYNQCVINYSTINNCPLEDSPKYLLMASLNSFFNNQLNSLAQYNA
jgi:hypothetical protein